jgi:hypothetical protein
MITLKILRDEKKIQKQPPTIRPRYMGIQNYILPFLYRHCVAATKLFNFFFLLKILRGCTIEQSINGNCPKRATAFIEMFDEIIRTNSVKTSNL